MAVAGTAAGSEIRGQDACLHGVAADLLRIQAEQMFDRPRGGNS